MKIAPVNCNPTQVNNNFKSRFIFNTAMHDIVENSTKTELARFQNVLQSMEKIDDGLYFWIKKQVKFYKLNQENIGYVVKYNLLKQDGNNEKAQELITTINKREMIEK